MKQDSKDIAQKSQEIAVGAFDFVFDALAQFIALIVSIFAPVSFGTSQTIASIASKYKYEIAKILGLFIGIVIISIMLLFMGNGSTNRQYNPIAGSTEVTDISGIEAKVLDVPYFNQYLSSSGINEPNLQVAGGLPLGGVICGASSSTMVAGYYGVIRYSNSDELKEFAYKDKGLNLPSKCANQSIGGAFGVTAYNGLCNQSSVAGMAQYFSLLNIPTTTGWGSPQFNTVKNAIDAGKPVIISLTTFDGFGHIAVIKGYTEDGRYVMNDPWTNVQSGNRSYSYAGNNALYQQDLGDQGDFKYYLVVG